MINKIYKICKDILEITNEEIAEVKEIYEGQLNYCHPFDMATASQQHELGRHNKETIEKLLELRDILIAGKDI